MSQDFPTYGRGDDTPEEPRQSPAAPPAQPHPDAPSSAEPSQNGSAPKHDEPAAQPSYDEPAAQPSYDEPASTPSYGEPPAPGRTGSGPAAEQPPARDDLPHYGPDMTAPPEPGRYAAPQPGAYTQPQPGAYTQPQSGNYGQPGAYGQPQPGAYTQPHYGAPYSQSYGQPGTQPGTQFGQQQYYGQQSHPQAGYPHDQYGAQYGQAPAQPVAQGIDPNPTAARIALVGGIVAGIYGLLMMSVQRTALREIAYAPGSDLNHPLRTDVIDTIFQLSVAALTSVALFLWLRDLMARRRAGRQPATLELVGLGLIATAGVFGLIWFGIIASTGFGSNDDLTGRLPAAYGYGGFGLLLLAAGLLIEYRLMRPDPLTVVRSAPQRPPWE